MMQAAPIPVPPPLSFPELSKPEECPKTVESTPSVQEEHLKEPSAEESVLHDLAPADRLLITKRLRVKNVLFLKGKRNRFYVRTPDHSLVYTVEEENSWWVGYFCYGLRPLQLRVTDGQGREVMRIDRPFALTARVFPCQLQHLEVFAPPGQKIGTVEQQWTAVRPVYLVKDADGEHKFWIRGPYITVSCFRDVQFRIARPPAPADPNADDAANATGAAVGATCKRWQGLSHAMFMAPVCDRFGVAFERDLTDEEKGLILAATLLMEYMYYDV